MEDAQGKHPALFGLERFRKHESAEAALALGDLEADRLLRRMDRVHERAVAEARFPLAPVDDARVLGGHRMFYARRHLVCSVGR